MPEIVSCPQCQRQLRVPDELLGQSVKCPSCGVTFAATVAAAQAPPPPPQWAEPAPQQQVSDDPRGPAASPPPDPGQHRPQQEWEREAYDERRPAFRADSAPHNGTLILVLGILSLAVCGLLGPVAWVMGNNDLAAMREGRMDRTGEGSTQAGRICGMIASIMLIISCVLGVLWMGLMFTVAAGRGR